MFDIGEHEGERFLTMEYIAGEVLSARIVRDKKEHAALLPLRELLEIANEVCIGLGAAHAVGVIHRDLKPDNVILANSSRVVITDFGIARALLPSETATAATGEFIGTPEYMSPEQAEGAAIDFRTDIYSFGVMLFEMLTGTLPFTGATPLITAAARLLRPPPDPRTRRLDIPESVVQVVMRCLARHPHERYENADAVATALAASLPSVSSHSQGALPLGVAPRSLTVQPASGPESIVSGDRRDGAATHTGQPGNTIGPIEVPAKSVAVLPFSNHGQPEDQYLADGLTEDLIDALSMVSGLRVRSRGAVAAAAATATDALAAGRALSADVLVEGTVRRSADRLRISARLIKVVDGVQIWAQRFERPAGFALTVSDEVAQAVATALTGSSLQQRTALQDAQAVDLYLRGRCLYQRGDPVSLNESATLIEQALALRPQDPTLLTIFAQVRSRQWFFGEPGRGAQAQAAAEQAIAAAPDRPEPRVALAMVRFYLSDAVGAVKELLETVKRAPSLSDVHDLLGRILIETGPANRGMRHLEHVLQLEPQLERVRLDLARVRALLGDFGRAIELTAQAALRGAAPAAVYMIRARFSMWRRDPADALSMLEHPELLSNRYAGIRRFVEIAALRTRFDAAAFANWSLGSDNSSPRGRGFYYQLLTEVACFDGSHDMAIKSLARAVDTGFFDLGWMDRCPLLEPLRLDPRFKALRRIVAGRAAQVQEALK